MEQESYDLRVGKDILPDPKLPTEHRFVQVLPCHKYRLDDFTAS